MTAVLKLIAGTVGAPAMTFTADATTGIYLPAAGTLGLSAAGVLALSSTNALTTLPLSTTLSQAEFFTGVITPTVLASSTNNYAPSGFSTAYTVRVSASSAIDLTGIAGGATGREILLSNIGTFAITLRPQNGSSTAANRFAIPLPIILGPGQAIALSYDGTASRWVSKSPAQTTYPPASGFKNLVVSATSDTAFTITADAITLTDDSGVVYNMTSASLSGLITNSGANGLDTGSEAANTWYSVWAIYNPTGILRACLLSTSATTPTLPSGYTFYARVGWIRNDGSSNLWRTIQYGRRAQIIVGTNPTAMPQAATGSAGSTSVPTWVSVTIRGGNVAGSYAPSTADAITIGVSAAGTQEVIIAPNNSYGSVSSTTNPPLYAFHNSDAAQKASSNTTFSLESDAIFWASTASGARLTVSGWSDNL